MPRQTHVKENHTMPPASFHKLRRLAFAAWTVALLASCGDRDLLPLQVELSRSVSKLPFVIALDQGLYEKYGLDVEVKLEDPEFEGGKHLPSDAFIARAWRRLRYGIWGRQDWRPPIRISGQNRRLYEITNRANEPMRVAIAATDCVVRQQIVARKDIASLDHLKGLRIGVSSIGSNSGFVALLLAEKMGWDPVQDVSILWGGNTLEALRANRVDAVVADERAFALAGLEGLSVLSVTAAPDEPIPGNSVMVNPEWLAEPVNRETATRFLKAMLEGIAIFHQERELVMDILERWHGIDNPEIAAEVYASGAYIPRRPYPCYEGIRASMRRYDSLEMRKYSAEDFYDDRLLRELDESGFIEALY